MRIAVMQPYFLPYIGYFQLIKSVDLFVLYDDIKYTKKGWINRNRILENGAPALISLALRADSHFCDVRDRMLAADFDRERLLRKIRNAYSKAPYFAYVFPILEEIVRHKDENLYDYIHHSVSTLATVLGVETKILISSKVSIDRGLTGAERVLGYCRALGATTYINALGGMKLYSRDDFASRGVNLKFLRSRPFEYRQFGNEFVPQLSILDPLMFNMVSKVQFQVANEYDLI